MKSCPNCLSKTLVPYMDTQEYNEDNQIFVIENIPSLKCTNCNEVFHNSEANKYIDKQLAIFKAEGFENRLNELRKEKGLTLEQLGDRLGLTKQRVGQIEQDYNLDVRTMYRLSKAIEEPIQNLFTFNQVVQKDNKFYISN